MKGTVLVVQLLLQLLAADASSSSHPHPRHRRRRLRRRQVGRELLVNGVDTELGQYPWHTRVGCCSGALIAPDVVLTAGHVLRSNPTIMVLSVGAYQTMPPRQQPLASLRNYTEQDFHPQRAFLHPGYTTIHYDFALFILNGSATGIEPVRLNRRADIPSLDAPDLVLLGTGTSALHSSSRPLVLQQTTTRYISNEECSRAKDPARPATLYNGTFLDDTNLCTYSENDGCVFDSGGPIILPPPPVVASRSNTSIATNATRTHKKKQKKRRDVLVGLISFGVDCGGPFFPAVNARVSAVTDWIDKIVCQYSQDPPADFKCPTKTIMPETTTPVVASPPTITTKNITAPVTSPAEQVPAVPVPAPAVSPSPVAPKNSTTKPPPAVPKNGTTATIPHSTTPTTTGRNGHSGKAPTLLVLVAVGSILLWLINGGPAQLLSSRGDGRSSTAATPETWHLLSNNKQTE